MTTGYWRDSERTAAAFVDVGVDGTAQRGYRTGDLAILNDRGNFLYCGRADSQIQVDGHRVELGEVEHQARSFLDGAGVAAVPIRTDDGRQEFLLFIQGNEGRETMTREYLGTQLPDYMVPRNVVSVAEFPLNLNGKIDRAKLAEIHRRSGQ